MSAAFPQSAAAHGTCASHVPRSIFNVFTLFFALILVATPPASAQSDDDETADTHAETRAESADGTATPTASFEQRVEVTAVAPEVGSRVELAGSELETGASLDAVEHLRGEPGLGATRRGSANLDPQVRGLAETQVATFVDGTRTAAAGPARMDSGLSHVGPHAVQRVEVVKGPYALAWGAGALAAVRFETHRPAFSTGGFGWNGRAGARYGDNGSAGDLFANLAGSSERLRFTLLAGAREGGDYESGSGRQVPGDFTSREVRAGFGLQAADGLVFDLDAGYQGQEDLDYPGRLLDASYFKTRSYSLRMDWTPAAAALDRFAAQVYSNRKDHRMNNDAKPTAQPAPGRIPPFGIDVDLPTESNTSGGRLTFQGSWGAPDDGGDWSAGLDAYRVEQTATRTIRRRSNGVTLFVDNVWPDTELDDLGLFVQSSRDGARWSASGTVRLDRWSADAGEVSPFFVANAGPAAGREEELLSAAVSGRFALSDDWSLSAGLGRAVRAPSSLELYSDRFPSTRFQVAAEFVGDPRLDPETAWQFDLGVAYLGDGTSLSIDAFHRRIDDYVTVSPDPSLPRRLPLSPMVVYRYVNGQRATFWGVEANLTRRLGEAWLLRAAAAWIRGDDDQLDEPAFGLAAPWASLGVRWQPPGASGLWVDLGARTVERQDRVATTRLERETPGYTVVDLAAGLRLAERWNLAAGVDNLLDEDYADHLNSLDPFSGARVEEPGRSLWARFEVGF